MPVESIRGRGATRNSTPTRFKFPERAVEGEWLDTVEALGHNVPRVFMLVFGGGHRSRRRAFRLLSPGSMG